MSDQDYDSTAKLTSLTRLAGKVNRQAREGEEVHPTDIETLATGFLALNLWLVSGGDLPEQWSICFECAVEVSVAGKCVRHGKRIPPRRPVLVPRND